MSVDTVIFDVGGVLLTCDHARVATRAAADGLVLSVEDMLRAESRIFAELDALGAGRDDGSRWRRFMTGLLAAGGLPAGDPRLMPLLDALAREHETVHLWRHVFADVRPTLVALRARGYRLGVLSNAPRVLRRVLTELALIDAFDAVVISAEEGLEKPDPALFARALARLGRPAAAALYVGDSVPVDMVGAAAAGLATVLVDRGGQRTGAPYTRIATLEGLLPLLDRRNGRAPQNPQ